MKHSPYLEPDTPGVARDTYTVRCRVSHGHGRWAPCTWTAVRLKLDRALEAAYRHEADTANEVPS